MAVFRGVLLAGVLLAFLLIAAPVQAILARRRSPHAAGLPVVFCRILLRLIRVRVEREGASFAPGPLLLASNHISWIDILVLGSVKPVCFLAKSEVASWPVLSTFAKVQGTVFVDRTRRRGIPPANRDMAARMREGRIVLLFPEGTTLDGTQPGRFLSSHFAAARDLLRGSPTTDAVSVQPVALGYSSPLAAWVGDDALAPHLWRVLRGKPMRCRLMLGVPLAYRRDTDRKRIARESRATVIGLLSGIPASFRFADIPIDLEHRRETGSTV